MNAGGVEVSQVLSMASVGGDAEVTARLSYQCEDPFAVSAVFAVGDTEVRWIFARDLLRDGLCAPAGQGDVLVAPAGGGRVTFTLRSGSGLAMLACDGAELAMFIRRVYAVVPDGEELIHVAMDRFLAGIV
ncbi:MAG: SsgA family sporulation/cell division regulator [Candidatus Nanopelagicales bacterium]